VTVVDPHSEVEAALHGAGHRFVIGCDEVGRGAIAGPVAVGMAVVDLDCGAAPRGLRDSKKRREQLAPLAQEWARFGAVGLASAEEIDRLGIMAALGLAGRRALNALVRSGAAIAEAIVLLDGNHDWLTPALRRPVAVSTRVKADRDCVSVAAASVVSKVHRDRIMIAADRRIPGYGWAGNKGYGSAGHFMALDVLGPSRMHRHTWLHARADPELRSELPAELEPTAGGVLEPASPQG
jgi:ribonuclease HII